MVSETDIPMRSLPCTMPGYLNPCPDCPLTECPFGTSTPGDDEYDRMVKGRITCEE